MKVKLTIFKAHDLPVRDEKLGSSDPYIKIKVPQEGKEDKLTKVGRTKTIKQTLNPEWNETFEFDVTSSFIVLELYDYDFMKEDEPMGKCRLNIDQLFPDHPIWVPVTGVERLEAAVLISLTGHYNEWVGLPALESWSSSPLRDILKIHPSVMIPSCNWRPKQVSDNMTVIGLKPARPYPGGTVDSGIAVHLIRWRKTTVSHVSGMYYERYIQTAKADGRVIDHTSPYANGRSSSLRWQWINGIIRASWASSLPEDPDVGIIYAIATYSTVDPHNRRVDPDATVWFQSLLASLGTLCYKDLPKVIMNIGEKWKITLPALCVVDAPSRPGWVSTPFLIDDSDTECAYLKIQCISQQNLLNEYLNKLSTTPQVSQVSIIDRPLDLLHWSVEGSSEVYWALTIEEEAVILIQCDRQSEEIEKVIPKILGTIRSN